MRRYETICIIRPSAGEEKISAIVEKTTGIIQQSGGNPLRVDHWGVKKLAYLIQKENQGYYIYIEYAGMPEAVKEIERVFRIDEQVLKYMTVKTQEAFVPDPEVDKDAEPVSDKADNADEDDEDQMDDDVTADE
jgi:small subunit ribosomal protein S6